MTPLASYLLLSAFLFAIGLAGACWCAARAVARSLAAAVVLTVAIALSQFQMIQYWNGRVPYENTTWAQYRALFLPRR